MLVVGLLAAAFLDSMRVQNVQVRILDHVLECLHLFPVFTQE